MDFGRHGTFYIRNGWISKGINVLDEGDKTIFSPKNMEEAIDKLGLGQAMVVSLRYWLDAFGITEETRENNEVAKEFTEFGRKIKEKDRYLERKGTLWLLHYKLATNKDNATTWYWFFNKFNQREFDDEIFIQKLGTYISEEGEKPVSENTIRKDYLCLKNTYLYENNINKNENIEDAISSPLRELKLITNSGNNKMYMKNKINIEEIAPEIFYYIVLDRLPTQVNQISLEDLTYKENFPGRIFNLNMNDVYDMTNILENKEYIKVNKKYGNNYIEIFERDKEKILNNYYSNNKID
ncbi:DUF4007 family protein [Sporanaerobacter acetigenes]|uniref:DUF4007 family protein n=1 Tax=Sporanaerobacter acetigenes TaxID=165813 RepID=UPI00104D816E|nr:DUF4007 family protein [Sporanaerobacter acetigenes]